MNEFLNSGLFTYAVIPLLICLARIVDVTIGTMRVIMITKGSRFLAPILGFFEILVWLLAIGQVMQNLTNIMNYFAYALGFALGNYVGILIEQKLALGVMAIRIITRKDASELIQILKNSNLGVTAINAEGATGPVHVIFTIVKRSNLPNIIASIKKYNPNAFYSLEDIRFASGGVFPAKSLWWKSKFVPFFDIRKAK
ncbi:MAG TPA: DUF2179 domain-containing protein [Desulfobacteraceae bacterium]|nr:DUF2179 domain-containing protein [Desulfobacteraceae bacterium]